MRNSGTARGLVSRPAMGFVAAAALAVFALGTPASAQQKAPAPAQGAAKAAQPAAAAEAPSWVKLCEKAPFIGKDKDGKEVRSDRSICLTHHERIDAATGMVLVSAAIREIEGSDRKMLMVMLPLGMSIPPGMQVGVYNKDMWDKVQKREQVDDTKLTPIKLAYTLCHSAGCTAETEATPEVLKEIQGGSGLIVYAVNGNGMAVAFPVSLNGFGAALSGKSADNAEYAKQRRALMEQIRQNQQKMLEEFKKQNEEMSKMHGSAAHGTAQQKAAPPAQPQQAPAQKK